MGVLHEEEIADIEVRANAATPGPLRARLGSGNNVCTALVSEAGATFDEFVCDVLPDYACKPGLAPRWEANRNFIEHAYADIPDLCRSLRSASSDAEMLFEALENMFGDLYLFGLAEIKLEDIWEGSARDAMKILKRLQQHRRKDPALAIGQKPKPKTVDAKA